MDTRKIFSLVVCLVFLCWTAHAQQISEADAYYVSAQGYLDHDDFKNAFRNAHLARIIYANLSNQDAVKQCDELIKQITDKVTPAMKAGYYYSIAEDYFFEAEGKPSIDLHTKTIYFATLARDAYSTLGDENNVQRSQDIIARSKSEIDKYFSEEKIKANTYYNIARSRYIEKDYLMALSYAENASLIYTLIPDPDGIERSQTLIRSINEKIEEIRKNAQTVCDNAMELYNEGNITGASLFADKCKSLYESINYGPGVLNANKIITLVNKFVEVTIDRKKDNARALFVQAQEGLLNKDYANATETLRQARTIYQELYDQADPKDGNLRGYYQRFIEDCDRLYLEISAQWGDARKKLQAEQFFTQAQQYYIDQYFDESLTYAKRSMELFEDLQDYVGVSKSSSLISTVNKRVETELMGDLNLTLAQEYLTGCDVENALVYATRARTIYETLIGSNKTQVADQTLALINESVTKKEEAAKLFNAAYEEFNAGSYNPAKSSAEQSHSIYVALNCSIGMSESESLLNRASDKVSEQKAKQRTIILSVLVVVVVLAILAVNYLKRKKEIDSVAKKAEAERLERDKREKKQWDVEKEIEAKQMAEQKFKEMIAEERDIVGEDKAPPEKESKEDLI